MESNLGSATDNQSFARNLGICSVFILVSSGNASEEILAEGSLNDGFTIRSSFSIDDKPKEIFIYPRANRRHAAYSVFQDPRDVS